MESGLETLQEDLIQLQRFNKRERKPKSLMSKQTQMISGSTILNLEFLSLRKQI
jgi:hypothetical protein